MEQSINSLMLPAFHGDSKVGSGDQRKPSGRDAGGNSVKSSWSVVGSMETMPTTNSPVLELWVKNVILRIEIQPLISGPRHFHAFFRANHLLKRKMHSRNIWFH